MDKTADVYAAKDNTKSGQLLDEADGISALMQKLAKAWRGE